MDKLTYAIYITQLPFKKGDFVVHRDAGPFETLNPYMIHEVDSFIEIHHHVSDWGTQTIGPRCVYLKQPWRNKVHLDTPWLSTSNYKVIPYDKLPAEIKAYADARTQQVQPTEDPDSYAALQV